MLCGCLEPLVGPAPGNGKHGGGFAGSYPGRRNEGQFVPTGGNALAAFDPNVLGNCGNSTGVGQMVAVTVPPGISPGQTLQVASPDGSGRLVQAVVPAGSIPGSTFMVQFPSNSVQQPPVMGQPYGHPMVGAGSHPMHHQPVPVGSGVTTAEQPLPTATAVPLHASGKESPPPMAAQGGYDGVAVLHPPASPPPSSPAPAPPLGEKLIMVEVPPGTSAGTPLHVQVPGENRTIMATVPPGNVKQFHVSYKPRVQPQPSKQQTNQQPPGAPTASPTTVPPAPPGQKLILVNVPPGTAPGATLHVQVPGENRIMAAKVPPGNVQSFHVAFTPQQLDGNISSGQRIHQQQRPQTEYNNSNGSNMYNSGNGHQNQGGAGMMGSMAPAVAGAAGAALMGAAAYSMFHHSSGGGDYSGNDAQYVDDGRNANYEDYDQQAQVDESGGGADLDVADY